ncbi:MAG: NAD(P)H-dependent oxidoreductase [Pseudomonadota bacterium]
MKILAFAASNHSNSINRQLVNYAAGRLAQMQPSVQIEYLDLNDYEMPIYSIDREKADGIHSSAKAFYEKIGEADALLIAFAEYNGFVTSAWKNIFDWMSRIDMKIWQDKDAVILAATPGSRAGANVLNSQETLAPFFGMNIKGKFGVGLWNDSWDGNVLIKQEDTEGVDAALQGLLS